jgi:hypothetical protein
MKKSVLLFSFLFFLSFQSTFAQCEEINQQKVMLVGDSWAFFMGADQTINTVFERWGHSNYKYYTNTTLSENGAETVDFMQADKQDEIQAQLDARPDIEVVHLSLGGNDVLGDWNVDFTPFQTDSLIDTVLTRLLTIVDFIKEARPGIRIFWSGYTYPNFGQVLHDAGIFQTVHPFYDTWESMGFPTFQQLNDILNEVSYIVEAYAAIDPQVDFVNATGLMQYTYGQDQELSVPPGGSYPPFAVPLPEGYPEYPSPKASMRDYGLFLDCFHLSGGGYRDLIGYHSQKFYHKFLMDDQYFLAQEGAGEGSVSSLGNVAPGELKMGIFEGEEFRPVITFNTTALPDAGVESASLFLRREALSGSNPVNGLQLRISNEAIGETIAVEMEDFDAETDAVDTPCVFGLSNGNGRWIRIELPESFLPLIDNTSTVQFMLTAPEGAEGLITFTNSNDPEFAPVLNVTHNVVTSVVENPMQTEPDVFVYPNPTADRVFVKSRSETIEQMQLFNQHGQIIQQAYRGAVSMDLRNVASGIYILKIYTSSGVAAKRVIRQ